MPSSRSLFGPSLSLGWSWPARELRLRGRQSLQAVLVLLWFALPLAYVLIARPPLYDGMRHFLFIIPPVFIFAAFALEFVFGLIHGDCAINAVLAALLLTARRGSVFCGCIRMSTHTTTHSSAGQAESSGIMKPITG